MHKCMKNYQPSMSIKELGMTRFANFYMELGHAKCWFMIIVMKCMIKSCVLDLNFMYITFTTKVTLELDIYDKKDFNVTVW